MYALIILGRLNPAASGQYTAGGWQEEEREAVTETGRAREAKGIPVRESRPRVKRSERISTAKHPTCILTGCNSLGINGIL